MMYNLFIYQLIIILFALLSAFFSCIETAIISSRKISIETLSRKGNKKAIRSLTILDNLEDAIGMVLIGNNISNIGATAFITYVVTKVFSYNDTQLLLVTIIQTMFFLLFCEIGPKIISKGNAEPFLMFFSMPILILMMFFKPLIKVALFFSEGITGIFNIKPGEISPIKSRDDIATFISIGRKEGIIDEEKNIYLSEILSFKNAHAYEIMIPAVDIVSIDVNESYKNIIAVIEKTRFSRLPVYRTKEDNFIGYIYYRDLLKHHSSKLEDIIIEPAFIPETKNVFDIYNKMQKERIPLLFVIDEYGNTSGMLTFEDIAEEIVGEIQTDDHPSEKIITKISEKKYLLSGRLDIDYFQRYFSIEINKRHFETLGGFIMSLSGDIPEKGDHIKFKEYEFIIDEVGLRTVDKIYFILPKNIK